MNASLITYGALFIAIICETIGTTFLKQSEQFTRLLPTLLTVLSYALSFYLLSITLKVLPVGIAYAIWSGIGIVVVSLIGLFLFKQHLDLAAYIGIGLIVLGVVVVNVFSKTIAH